MKKLKIIIGLIVAFVIGISTTVGATTIFNSKDITYSSSATSKTNVKDSLDELYTKVGQCPESYVCYRPLADHVKIGDYIKMTPTSTSYTISTSLTGYTSNQTINPSELNLWRVIRKNEDGTIEMVSDKVSSKNVNFYGKVGYINLVGGLNTIAGAYTNQKYVINTRHIGYSNQTQTLADSSKLSQTTSPWTKTTNSGWTATSSGFTETEEAQGAGDIGYTTDYQLVNAVYGNMIGKNPSGTVTPYWIASRRFNYNTTTFWQFSSYYVSTNGKLLIVNMYDNDFYSYSSSYAIRPIVTLKSSVEKLSGNGTSSSPYILN